MGLLSGAARLARGKVGNRPLANFASDLMRPMGGGAAAQSPNAQALQGLTQRLAARMPEGSSDADTMESIKSLIFYNVPGLRNSPRLSSARSVDELASVLDEAGADPAQWVGRMGL